ncbi:MAG TPA: Rieske 2Fe-2S domain-containing protein [Xanthobacteraceae bacterium]|nr:Rieske 2Fe-2S domain-containing protein [Xanthobacteraceae bacterium]
MLSAAQQELLIRTGPGTPMGELFRRYWIPALLAEELPEPDCPPVRVKLLSERLIAFKDTQGRIGLVDEFCAHRGVSLWFGRNEENGLRCPYHGWKYDVTGQCVEVPSEPEESGFCKRIKLKSYPGVELGGVVWTYMGPPEAQPPLPAFEWATVPAAHRFVSKRLQESNYLQAMEGGIDSSHVSFLHRGELHSDPLHRGTQGARYQADTAPKFEVIESRGGLLIGARRNADPGTYYWRITQWIMPWYTMIPPYGANALNGHAWVPIDDENCWVWNMTHHPARPLTELELGAMRSGQGMYAALIPGTYRPVANKENDYLIDRAAQKAGKTYSGVKGIAMQDASLQESMGPLQDRTKENLVSTDNAIIMARHRLMKAARDLEKGVTPPGLDPATHQVRSASLVLPCDVPFQIGAKEALIARPDVVPDNV